LGEEGREEVVLFTVKDKLFLVLPEWPGLRWTLKSSR